MAKSKGHTIQWPKGKGHTIQWPKVKDTQYNGQSKEHAIQ